MFKIPDTFEAEDVMEGGNRCLLGWLAGELGISVRLGRWFLTVDDRRIDVAIAEALQDRGIMVSAAELLDVAIECSRIRDGGERVAVWRDWVFERGLDKWFE